MYLETKFYIFWKFFTIFLEFLKITALLNFFIISYLMKSCDFQKFWKNSKNFSKNIKFGLQAHFNMKIVLRSKVGVLLSAHISIFKVQIVNSKLLTCSSYWNMLKDQILYFLNFFYFFRIFENHNFSLNKKIIKNSAKQWF